MEISDLEFDLDLIARPDSSILSEIWDLIWREDPIRTVDIDSVSISVANGCVSLAGHLSRASNRKLIEDLAHSVPGVVAVANRLVVDDELILEVAQELGTDERTRRLVLPVGCSHGWIGLGGEVPTRELQLVAERLAAQVPSVRGVVSLPGVVGDSQNPERRAVQPRIQARAYDHNKQEGVVTEVVIQPRNRLVTHAVVRRSEFYGGKFAFPEYLVPVRAMEIVNPESIILERHAPPLNAFPSFDPSAYRLAPVDWRPPYPYAAGTVRWRSEQRYSEDAIPNHSPAMEPVEL